MARLFKRKNDFSKTIVILDILLFILYIIINIIMMWIKETAMPTDINVGVFSFLTGELGLLSFIKRSKITTEATQKTIQNITENKEQLLLLQQQQLPNNQNGAG